MTLRNRRILTPHKTRYREVNEANNFRENCKFLFRESQTMLITCGFL